MVVARTGVTEGDLVVLAKADAAAIGWLVQKYNTGAAAGTKVQVLTLLRAARRLYCHCARDSGYEEWCSTHQASRHPKHHYPEVCVCLCGCDCVAVAVGVDVGVAVGVSVGVVCTYARTYTYIHIYIYIHKYIGLVRMKSLSLKIYMCIHMYVHTHAYYMYVHTHTYYIV